MADNAANDLELQLKKRARRRLVGAIALVLLMIIVLPIILHDRSAEQAKPEVTITIPNETNTIQHDNITVNEVSKPVTLEDIAHNSDAAANAEIVDHASDKQTHKEILSLTKPAAKSEAKTLDTKSEVKNTDEIKSNAKFYVQIGVFSDVDNVKKLQTKLSDLGYKSQTEKISTDKGEKIRLRTSTFKERNEAAIALENIKSSGMAGIVVSQK